MCDFSSLRQIIKIIGGASVVAMALTGPLFAQDDWPERPVKFMIGFPPGGSADTVARILGAELSQSLGQQFVVESRPGASGNIATQVVLNAPADGYTVYLAQIVLATNPPMMDVDYDPKTDLQMISQVVNIPVVALTNPDSGLEALQDVIAASKEKDLKVGGVFGTSSHLAPSLLGLDQGFKFKFIPYKGGALAVQALLSGEVDVVFDQMSGTNQGLLSSGELNAVAVMQETPVAGLDISAASTAGVTSAGFFRSWMGVAVKAGTPQPIVDKLYAAVTAALQKPAVKEKLEQLGNEVVSSGSPQEFQDFYLGELDRFAALIDAIGYKPQ